jgi:hypothetical protein
MKLHIQTNCGCDATITGVVTMPLHDMRIIWKANLKNYSGRVELLFLDLTKGQGTEVVTAVVNDVMEVT